MFYNLIFLYLIQDDFLSKDDPTEIYSDLVKLGEGYVNISIYICAIKFNDYLGLMVRFMLVLISETKKR